jgi:hypothetical protein
VLRLLSAVTAAALVAGGGFALAGVSFPGLGGGVRVPPEKAHAFQRLVSVATTDSSTQPAPAPLSAPQPIPGRILGSNVPVPVPPSVLRAKNGWLTSDGRTLVAVYAGTAGGDPAIGRVVIVRQDLAAGKQTVRILDAGPTGVLTIVAAPLGVTAETSGQRGEIHLQTPGRRTLVLDLGADKVSQTAHGASVP